MQDPTLFCLSGGHWLQFSQRNTTVLGFNPDRCAWLLGDEGKLVSCSFSSETKHPEKYTAEWVMAWMQYTDQFQRPLHAEAICGKYAARYVRITLAVPDPPNVTFGPAPKRTVWPYLHENVEQATVRWDNLTVKLGYASVSNRWLLWSIGKR